MQVESEYGDRSHITRRTRIAAGAAFATSLIGLCAFAYVTQTHRAADSGMAAVRLPEFPSYADRMCYQGAAKMRLQQVIMTVERELRCKYGGGVAFDFARVPSTTTWEDIQKYYTSRMPDGFQIDYDFEIGIEYWINVWFREGFSSRRAIAAVLVDHPYPDYFYVEGTTTKDDGFKWLIVFDVNRKDELRAQHSNRNGCLICDDRVEDSTSEACIAQFCTKHPDDKHWCSTK